METNNLKRKKPIVRYSKKVAKFIISKVEEGITVSEVCRKYPKIAPSANSIYRWRREYPEFREELDIAYQTFMYLRIDEMNDLSSAPLPKGLEKIELNAELQRRRLRIDTLKFQAAKLAPKMIPELSDKVKIEHEGVQNITVQSYATQEVEIPVSVKGDDEDDTVH